MKLLERLDINTAQWHLASTYEKFEQVVVLADWADHRRHRFCCPAFGRQNLVQPHSVKFRPDRSGGVPNRLRDDSDPYYRSGVQAFDLDNGQTSAERCTGRTVVLIAVLAVIRKFIAGCSHYCLRRRLLAGSRTRPQ